MILLKRFHRKNQQLLPSAGKGQLFFVHSILFILPVRSCMPLPLALYFPKREEFFYQTSFFECMSLNFPAILTQILWGSLAGIYTIILI